MTGQVLAVEVLRLSHAELPVVLVDGQPWVVFSRAMEQLGLNAEAQARRLRRRPWAAVGSATVPVPNDQPRRALVVDEATFLSHVFSVQISRLRAEHRDALIAYQRETAQAIRAYWTRGVAVNPRGLTDAQVASLEAQVAAMRAGVDVQRDPLLATLRAVSGVLDDLTVGMKTLRKRYRLPYREPGEPGYVDPQTVAGELPEAAVAAVAEAAKLLGASEHVPGLMPGRLTGSKDVPDPGFDTD